MSNYSDEDRETYDSDGNVVSDSETVIPIEEIKNKPIFKIDPGDEYMDEIAKKMTKKVSKRFQAMVNESKGLNVDPEIRTKVGVYKHMLSSLIYETKLAKHRLDLYREQIHRANSAIQLSVVWLSAGSSAIQALASQDYEFFYENNDITIDSDFNGTQTFSQNIPEVTKNFYGSLVPFITIFISTYSTLTISAARHYKLEENIGNVTNLRDRYVELIGRIQEAIDSLKPWEYPDYYELNKKIDEQKSKTWASTIDNIEKEYKSIITSKKELYVLYEQILHTTLYKKYSKVFPSLDEGKAPCCCLKRWWRQKYKIKKDTSEFSIPDHGKDIENRISYTTSFKDIRQQTSF